MDTAGAIERTGNLPRRGYTLIELLLVLTLLILVLGLSLPTFRRLSIRGEVRNAARQLRAELMRARLRAIETGQVLCFQYQPGTGQYRVVPAVAPPVISTADGEGLETSASFGDESLSELTSLPAEVVFMDLQADIVGENTLDELPSGPTADSTEWSSPIAFYPNGRSFNGRFLLVNSDYRVDVILRGLTGAIRLGQIQTVQHPEEEPLEDVAVGF